MLHQINIEPMLAIHYSIVAWSAIGISRFWKNKYGSAALGFLLGLGISFAWRYLSRDFNWFWDDALCDPIF
jgi:hypothetical protein